MWFEKQDYKINTMNDSPVIYDKSQPAQEAI